MAFQCRVVQDAPIVYKGITYGNNEAAYQASKTLIEEEREIFIGLTAKKAKHEGYKVTLREDWEEVKFDIMLEILRCKFNQNKDLKKKLLATGDKLLIEGNTWGDEIWGVCNGKGLNMLGKLLMKVRDELRTGGQEMSIEESILALVKYADPDDPVKYVNNIIRSYALDKINDSILNCKECDICKNGLKSTPYGGENADILIISESISKEQYKNKKGSLTLPMMDEDGEILENAFNILKANKKAIFITNCVNCFTGMRRSSDKIKLPSDEQRTSCKKYLNKIIEIIKPSVIITLGAVATNALSHERVAILECRGKAFKYYNYDVVPTLHPNFFRETSGYDEETIRSFENCFLEDLSMAFKIARENNPDSLIGDII